MTQHPARPAGTRRPYRIDLLLAAIGVVALLGAALVIDGDTATPVERAIFEAANDLPGVLYVPMWPLMQIGNIAAPAVVALGAAFKRRWHLVLALLASIPLKLVAARVVKDAVVRHRPAAFLENVTLRGDAPASGQSFVSGHAIVAFAIAAVLDPYLQGGRRVALWALAAVVGIGRIYVGAHLPLDVLGGAGLGLTIGASLNLLLGRWIPPSAKRPESDASAAPAS